MACVIYLAGESISNRTCRVTAVSFRNRLFSRSCASRHWHSSPNQCAACATDVMMNTVPGAPKKRCAHTLQGLFRTPEAAFSK